MYFEKRKHCMMTTRNNKCGVIYYSTKYVNNDFVNIFLGRNLSSHLLKITFQYINPETLQRGWRTFMCVYNHY